MKGFSLLLGFILPLALLAPKGEAAAPLLGISEGVKNGVRTIFVRPTTTFRRSTMVLDASVDGQRVGLEHPSRNLWLFPVAAGEGSLHVLALEVSLADTRKLTQVEASLAAVAEKIARLQDELAAATDPDEIAALNAELGEQQRLARRLEADRENLKNFIGSQKYFYQANS